MGRYSADTLGSLIASAIIALMVAMGGAALAPTEPLAVYASSENHPADPLTMCRAEGAATVCVREES